MTVLRFVIPKRSEESLFASPVVFLRFLSRLAPSKWQFLKNEGEAFYI
jgi:hypothetical protein